MEIGKANWKQAFFIRPMLKIKRMGIPVSLNSYQW